MSPTGERSLLRNTVTFSITEGVYSQVYIALATAGNAFITRFALLLGAMPFHLGLLAAIGQLSLVFQPFALFVTRRGTSWKKIIVRLATAGRTLALLYGLLPFVFPRYIAIWAFLLLLSVSASLHAMSTNAWIAWISDMVPGRVRGRFFSWRSRYLMVASLLIGYVLGAFVDLFDPKTVGFVEKFISVENAGFFSSEHINVAFIFVFTVAAVFGLLGVAILRRQPEQPKKVEEERVTAMLSRPFRDRNFRRFLVYNVWWMLAVGIGSPFWLPFMIQKLHMSLVSIQVYGTISAVASILALRPWGRVIDRFGNRAAMRAAIVLGGIKPAGMALRQHTECLDPLPGGVHIGPHVVGHEYRGHEFRPFDRAAWPEPGLLGDPRRGFGRRDDPDHVALRHPPARSNEFARTASGAGAGSFRADRCRALDRAYPPGLGSGTERAAVRRPAVLYPAFDKSPHYSIGRTARTQPERWRHGETEPRGE
ncbi:MFS transporter [candidate division WOR-3 bacterium]|nr:MFS transporter [candidate division WOR-3 bacterium]